MIDDNAKTVAPQTRKQRVAQRIRAAADSLPGERNNLPSGTLGGVPVDPQGDENRRSPANAPTIPK